MENCIYKKKLCMTEFGISRMHFCCPQYFDARMGQKDSVFIYVVSGQVLVSSPGIRLCGEKGDLLYIPEGLRYSASWRGDSDIEYYAMRIISNKVTLSESGSVIALQCVHTEGIADIERRIHDIYTLFATCDRVNMIRALGQYYSLYAEILPRLAFSDVPKYSDAVIIAAKYIDTHYTEDFSVTALAAVCHVSESLLYHLFRDELGTTPIKYRNALRVEHAAADLRLTKDSLAQIAEKNGFHSVTYFRETFKAETGLTPAEYRKLV